MNLQTCVSPGRLIGGLSSDGLYNGDPSAMYKAVLANLTADTTFLIRRASGQSRKRCAEQTSSSMRG